MAPFTDQIFKNSLWQKTRPSISFKTRDWAFQTLEQALKALKITKFSAESWKSAAEYLKSSVVYLWYNTAHAALITYGTN